MGITLNTRKKMQPKILPAKHTWARQTIVDVAKAGEHAGLKDHIYNVLEMFLGSPNNANQLRADAISAVSKWILAYNITSTEIPFLKKYFDHLEIEVFIMSAKHFGLPQKSTQIAFMIALEMDEALQEIRQHA